MLAQANAVSLNMVARALNTSGDGPKKKHRDRVRNMHDFLSCGLSLLGVSFITNLKSNSVEL